MRRVFLLWLSALLPTLLWAHPEWKEASCIGVIDEKNTFALTVKFDIPSFLLGQLPKDAPMPPWAATVCERVGNTLDNTATFRPARANCSEARMPEPPAPTMTTSNLRRAMELELDMGHSLQRT